MAQTLLLGLGGTGSRIVNYVASDLKKKGYTINDGTICCAVLDTNDNDRKKITEAGVGIPVIATSKDRKIEDYLRMYSNRGVRDWMPESPSLKQESMKDGASQMRTKSRLAFMDILEDRSIRELETYIDKLFDKRDDAKIRVMVVSSLAGGTGSGMFIQTALWLRKYFAKRRCMVTIRGIFVLPDVFIKTIEDIRTDETEIQSLYANAYGAIRELNAITKIKAKGLRPQLPVKIDNLFDSESGQPDGQPVYDYAFFVDDISEGGSCLSQIDHYEQVVARLVYMQLYAPMHDDLYSEEDNLFKRFQRSEEPLFGSCGTAKAVYPAGDVLHYCSLRAAQESISTGWRKIDDEIRDKQRKEEERERNGTVLAKRIDPRLEFIRLFDAKAAKVGDQVGMDRLFVNIAHDVHDEERIPGEDGGVQVNYLDKVEEFLAKLEEAMEAKVDTTDVGGLSTLRLSKTWAQQTTDDRTMIQAKVAQVQKNVQRFLEDTDASVDAMAQELVDLICPTDMGDVNQGNEHSVFGLLSKVDNNGEKYFVHPIAVRYLLYKLCSRLNEEKNSILLDSSRSTAEKGYGNGVVRTEFDNTRTSAVEDTPEAYLKSKAFLQNEAKFLATFKQLYIQHNGGQYELCRKYAIEALKFRLAVLLTQRLEKLVGSVERFFKDLVKVSNSLSDGVAQNIRKNEQTKQKIIYVCASGEEKEALYRSLRFNTGASDANVNAIIVRSLYGQFCSEENPDANGNKPYKGKSVEVTFFQEVLSTYRKLILTKNRDEVDMDIYSAVCKSADFAYEKKQAKEQEDGIAPESDRLNVDLETGEVLEADTRHTRHVLAMQRMVEDLLRLGAPFLITTDELPENDEEDVEPEIFTPIKKRKTFWGFHPRVAEKCPELAEILGVNVASQQNAAYEKNELDCYQAVYGVQAGYVPKFNELSGGDYFTHYSQVVRGMVRGVAAGQPEELVHTPHLDKTWHLFLPYITPEKRIQEDSRFYRLFWLAMAYGMITLTNNGKYQISRTKKTATGQYQQDELILSDGEPIGKVDVVALLNALKFDGTFVMEAAHLEAKFLQECAELDSYEGTQLLRGYTTTQKGKSSAKITVGGLASTSDTNALTMIVRYHHAPRHDNDVTAMMIQSLEALLCRLVSGKYDASAEKKVQFKGYELCERVYEASALKDKDIDLIRPWKDAWAKKSAED